MDPYVIAAMAKWPNVPAVYGWLSLTESGQWRLHPQGDATDPSRTGESITSPQILAFIDRNYACDEEGQWFFQNGPQRVYVRLDAAPYIAHLTSDTGSGKLKLRTHTGLDIQRIDALYLDDEGRLWASSDRGPALIAGRDISPLLAALEVLPASATHSPSISSAQTDLSGQADAMDDVLERLATGNPFSVRTHDILGFPFSGVPVHPGQTLESLEAALHFRRLPRPAASL